MSDPIILVMGMGRCGSSLVMQMLDEGGIRCTTPPDCSYPAFEDSRAVKPGDWSWLEEYRGRAVKILNPDLFPPPPGLGYKIIWLDRNALEQAKSWRKLTTAFGYARKPGAKVKSIGVIRKELKFRRKVCMRVIEGLGGEILWLRFEDIIQRPWIAAAKLAWFAGLDKPAGLRMMTVVVKRDTHCLKNQMLEPALLQARQRRMHGMHQTEGKTEAEAETKTEVSG